MQLSPIQQNKQVNFTSRVFIKNCSEIFKSKNVQNQIARLEKNGNPDIISLRGYTSKQDGVECVNMNIVNHKNCEEREKDFFFTKGGLRLGAFYKKLLKENPINTWKY